MGAPTLRVIVNVRPPAARPAPLPTPRREAPASIESAKDIRRMQRAGAPSVGNVLNLRAARVAGRLRWAQSIVAPPTGPEVA